MIITLIEKADDLICNICESNFILNHITRLGMSDDAYIMAMVKEHRKKADKPVVGKRFRLARRGKGA